MYQTQCIATTQLGVLALSIHKHLFQPILLPNKLPFSTTSKTCTTHICLHVDQAHFAQLYVKSSCVCIDHVCQYVTVLRVSLYPCCCEV